MAGLTKSVVFQKAIKANLIKEALEFVLREESGPDFEKLLGQKIKELAKLEARGAEVKKGLSALLPCEKAAREVSECQLRNLQPFNWYGRLIVQRAEEEYKEFGQRCNRFDPSPLSRVDENGLPFLAVFTPNEGEDKLVIRSRLGSDSYTGFGRAWLEDLSKLDLSKKLKLDYATAYWTEEYPVIAASQLFKLPNSKSVLKRLDLEALSGYTREETWTVDSSNEEARSYIASGRVFRAKTCVGVIAQETRDRVVEAQKAFGKDSVFIIAPANWKPGKDWDAVGGQCPSSSMVIGKSGLLFWVIESPGMSPSRKPQLVVEAGFESPKKRWRI